MGMEKKYFITTYGCQLNVHESEKLAGILRSNGYTESGCLEEADVVIFNTCAIRGNAENRALGNIGALKKWKRSSRKTALRWKIILNSSKPFKTWAISTI